MVKSGIFDIFKKYKAILILTFVIYQFVNLCIITFEDSTFLNNMSIQLYTSTQAASRYLLKIAIESVLLSPLLAGMSGIYSGAFNGKSVFLKDFTAAFRSKSLLVEIIVYTFVLNAVITIPRVYIGFKLDSIWAVIIEIISFSLITAMPLLVFMVCAVLVLIPKTKVTNFIRVLLSALKTPKVLLTIVLYIVVMTFFSVVLGVVSHYLNIEINSVFGIILSGFIVPFGCGFNLILFPCMYLYLLSYIPIKRNL